VASRRALQQHDAGRNTPTGTDNGGFCVAHLPAAGLVAQLQDRLVDEAGTFLHERETLADAVDRSLCEKANVRGLQPRQLHVFDDPDRDERGWVLSVAHVEVVRLERLASRFAETTRLMPAAAPGRLSFDHRIIIERAVDDLRVRYRDEPDPDRLLGDEFTLRELRLAHEAVAGEELQRDAFRRTMDPQLIATGTTITARRGRRAEVFRRRQTA